MSKETAARSVVEISPNLAALSDAAAERIVAAAEHAIDAHGRFVIALSGGSTPRRTYELLAREPYASRVDWSRVHVVWGDERCVPPSNADSNYRMAREALLDRVPIPATNIHRMHGEDDPLRQQHRTRPRSANCSTRRMARPLPLPERTSTSRCSDSATTATLLRSFPRARLSMSSGAG